MFRFLHAADIHLDSPLRGLSYKDQAPAEVLREASRKAFRALVERAIDEEVAFVLLAGDLLDGDWKDARTPIFLAQQIGRLERESIPVLAVLGNHDAGTQLARVAALPRNLHLFGSAHAETRTVEGAGEPVVVHGQSYSRRKVTENLSLGYPARVPGAFNIGLLHTSLTGREGHETYAPCTPEDLATRGYDYWALGHVHAREVVSEDPWIVFPGCLQGRHPRETGPRSCTLVTVEHGQVAAVEAIELDAVRWEHIEVRLGSAEGEAEILETVRAAMAATLDQADGRPVALRVSLLGWPQGGRALLADPRALADQVRVLAAEVGDDALWIERVTADLTPPQVQSEPPDGALPGHALAELVQQIRHLPDSVAALGGLPADIAALLRKIPAPAMEQIKAAVARAATAPTPEQQPPPPAPPPEAAASPNGVAGARDEAWLGPLVARAKALLAARLQEPGADR